MQTLINTRSQWLNNLGRLPANGKIYVYAGSSSTSLVRLYSDAALENEVPNPQTLDTAGRLPQTVYFEEDSVYVRAYDEGQGVQQLMFSFHLEGRALSPVDVALSSLDDFLSSGVMGDSLVYHAKKIKYLKWTDDLLSENGITIWNAPDDSGSWVWETTVLDTFDIGVMDGENINAGAKFQSAAAIKPATFAVRSGTYKFDNVKTDVNWQNAKIVVEPSAEFSSYNGVWTMNKPPEIFSRLAGVTWNCAATCDYYASLVDSIAPESKVGRFFADANFTMNFNAAETIALRNPNSTDPIISVESGRNAGKLSSGPSVGSFFNPAGGGAFEEGKLSQMTSYSESSYNCTGVFTVDMPWSLQAEVTIPCDVIVDSSLSTGIAAEAAIYANRILRARQGSIGVTQYAVNISMDDKGIMLEGSCFPKNTIGGRKSAQSYVQNFNGLKPIIRDYYLYVNSGNFIDGAIYENCVFDSDGNDDLYALSSQNAVFRNCVFNNKFSIKRDRTASVGRLLFDECKFDGGLEFKWNDGVEIFENGALNLSIKNCSASSLSVSDNFGDADVGFLSVENLTVNGVRHCTKGKFMYTNTNLESTYVSYVKEDGTSTSGSGNSGNFLSFTVKNLKTMPFPINNFSKDIIVFGDLTKATPEVVSAYINEESTYYYTEAIVLHRYLKLITPYSDGRMRVVITGEGGYYAATGNQAPPKDCVISWDLEI